MYKVLKTFTDLQDAKQTKSGSICHHYNAGDVFPRQGYEPSAERISELSGSDNRQGVPLIEVIPDPAEKVTKSLEKLTVPQLKAMAVNLGITVGKKTTKAALIKAIEESEGKETSEE